MSESLYFINTFVVHVNDTGKRGDKLNKLFEMRGNLDQLYPVLSNFRIELFLLERNLKPRPFITFLSSSQDLKNTINKIKNKTRG